jgi:hypothetical protein
MKMSKELVSHPDHYNKKDRKECWDEMGEAFGDASVVIFDILSAYKYYYRMGRKEDNPEEQDKAKAKAYLEHAKNLIIILASSKQDVSQLAEMLLEMEDYLDEQD